MTHKSWLIFLFCELTIYLRLNILGSKRKLPKRRNFTFDASNGFGGIYVQSHYIRILPVKIPRYSNGNIIDCDIYDFLQGEKTVKYIDKTHTVWVIIINKNDWVIIIFRNLIVTSSVINRWFECSWDFIIFKLVRTYDS